MSRIKLSGDFDEMDLEDRLNWLRTYNDILGHTQAQIDEGYFDDKSAAGSTIMTDYIEKSGDIIMEILRMIFGDRGRAKEVG